MKRKGDVLGTLISLLVLFAIFAAIFNIDTDAVKANVKAAIESAEEKKAEPSQIGSRDLSELQAKYDTLKTKYELAVSRYRDKKSKLDETEELLKLCQYNQEIGTGY